MIFFSCCHTILLWVSWYVCVSNCHSGLFKWNSRKCAEDIDISFIYFEFTFLNAWKHFKQRYWMYVAITFQKKKVCSNWSFAVFFSTHTPQKFGEKSLVFTCTPYFERENFALLLSPCWIHHCVSCKSDLLFSSKKKIFWKHFSWFVTLGNSAKILELQY